MQNYLPEHYPPWLLKGEAYVLNYWLNPHLLRQSTPLKLSFSRFGRVVQVVLVRYHQTPFGAYDELFILDHPLISKRCMSSIPKIFVSSPLSIESSQKLWGIHKELAEFSWEDTGHLQHCTIKYQHKQLRISLKRTKQARTFYINSHHLPKAMLTIGQYWNDQHFQFTPQLRGHISKLHQTEWHDHHKVLPEFSKARYLQSFYSPNFQLLLPEAHIKPVSSKLMSFKYP